MIKTKYPEPMTLQEIEEERREYWDVKSESEKKTLILLDMMEAIHDNKILAGFKRIH